MNGNATRNVSLKLCRNVNVYELGDKSLVFRSGHKTVKLTYAREWSFTNAEFIERISTAGMRIEELSRMENGEEFANALVGVGLARWAPGDLDQCDDKIEEFLIADHLISGIMSADPGGKLLKQCGVTICSGANPVRDEIEGVFSEFGVMTRRGGIELGSDKRLSLSIPPRQWEIEVVIIDLVSHADLALA